MADIPAVPIPAPPTETKDDAINELIQTEPELKKELESVIEKYIRKREDEKKKADEAKKKADEDKKKADEDKKNAETFAKTSGAEYGLNLPILYDSIRPFHMPGEKTPKWYDTMSIRGYTQIRFDRTLATAPGSAPPNLIGDRSINGVAEDFMIRRLRLVLSGDLGDYLSYYLQPDFAVLPQGSTVSTYFAQMRDAYADVFFDKEKEHRLRIGLSKVPYGFENMQSSRDRVALDRTDAINSAVSPNERDLGIFYYWATPDKRALLKALVDSGLKGSGNFGIFAFGVYDGQGGSVPEANLNLHTVARITYPVQLDWKNGQVVEASLQGYAGDYVVTGAAIRPLGQGNVGIVPANTGGNSGIHEERIATTFVFYPQPFGFQAEWQVGNGPGLNDEQTAVINRSLNGGYVMGMYRHDTCCYGIFTPYCRWQQYRGGYRQIANAPYGRQRELDLGVEWQFTKYMELVCEYSLVNTPNFTALNTPGAVSYRDFEGSVLRFQFQFNY
ncbi:MAG: OprO/OprP family phosphate-selective porin [Gemmataceae bacterium]|nr:OprO/OprP family phosphate-selective porin [Gemmataceae bacterium]